MDREEGGEDRIVLGIGGLVFAVTADRPVDELELPPSYPPFYTEAAPDVQISARFGELPPLPPESRADGFDSEALWRLFRAGDETVFELKQSVYGRFVERRAFFDRDLRRGRIFIRPPSAGATVDQEPRAGRPPMDPLENPLFQALMICLLAQREGALVHACGIDDHGRGMLFLGKSGAGKTTMSGHWQGEGTILCDDRIVVRRRDGRFWIYGTPWHGDCAAVDPRGVPLERIFFLHKNPDEQRAERVSERTGLTRLTVASFPPLWDPEAMASTLDLFHRLAQQVPCFDLFCPRAAVDLDLLRCAG